MKRVLTTLLGVLIGHFCHATGQVPDFLIYKGDTIAIFSNPLEQYFNIIGKRELPDFFGCGSTACWRGYMAIWELKNDSLFLKQITSCHNECGHEIKDANLTKMFGTNNVFAYWYTGQIMAPKGNRIQYIHMGYGSIYVEEQIFSIEKGLIKTIKIKSNKKLADKIYAEEYSWKLTYLSSDTIFYYIKNKIDWEKLDKGKLLCDDKYLLLFNKKGKINKVKFEPYTNTSNRENWLYNFVNYKCRRKIKKSLKKIRLDYLKPEMKFTISIEIFYSTTEKKLELWKHWD